MSGLTWSPEEGWHDRGEATAGGYKAGDRVQLHPALDAWMMGDRYGTVERVGRAYLHVRCDRSNKIRRILPESVTPA